MAGYEGLWKIPANGGEPVELYDSGLGQGGDPQPGEALLAGWTADGGYLLFWQGEMLSASLLADGAPFYALPAEGGPAVLLAGGDDVVLYHDDFWSAVSGGSYLALTMGGGRETWTNKRIAIADAETGQVQTFTDGTVAAFSPVLSPDRAKIAYVAGPDVGFVGGGEEGRAAVFQRHIWVIGDDAASSGDGPVPRQLTDDPAYRDERPLWSADGGQILFVRMDQQEQVSLWLLPAEDTEARQVAGGLGPLPGPETGWFGYYGYVDWDTLFDWWQTPVQAAPPPNPTPVPTPEPLPTVQPGEADREAGSAACAEARSGQPPVGLVVEEHPLLGPPGSPEETEDWFQTADGPTGEILAARAAYRDSAALLLAEDNRALEPFGYRLELDRCGDAFNATYRLYRDGQVYRSGITAFSPVSVNASGTAFVMQIEVGGLPYTLTEASLEASGMLPAHAAYVGDDLVTVQVSDTLRVKLAAQPVYDVPVGNELAYLVPLQDRQTSHGLESPWSYDGRWAIEWGETTAENAFPEAGHVVVDGQDLNSSCGYDEVFNFTLLGGRPFYFFEQGGKVNLAYDGQVVGADYDSIPHYRCCSGAVVNPGVSPNMVWFFATRGEQWYYVEVYVPLAEMPTATLCPAQLSRARPVGQRLRDRQGRTAVRPWRSRAFSPSQPPRPISQFPDFLL
ncbi:MAG: hypothetical protein P8129_02150 [Anaerolineae bacterium]